MRILWLVPNALENSWLVRRDAQSLMEEAREVDPVQLILQSLSGRELLCQLPRRTPWCAYGQGGCRRPMQCPENLVLLEDRSEEHTSELQSLMRISYAVFCLKKKNNTIERPITMTK